MRHAVVAVVDFPLSFYLFLLFACVYSFKKKRWSSMSHLHSHNAPFFVVFSHRRTKFAYYSPLTFFFRNLLELR